MSTIVWSTPSNLGNLPQGAPIAPINLTAISVIGGALTYRVISGQLPSGLSLSAAGQLTGTPNDNQSYKFVVRATRTMSSSVNVSDQTFTLTVVGHPPVAAATVIIPDQFDVVNFSYQLTATDTDTTDKLTYRLVQGNLPQALTLSSTGLISGPIVTQSPASYSVTVEITDGTYRINQQVQLRIKNRPVGTTVAPIIINPSSDIGLFRVDDQFSYKIIGSLDGKNNQTGLTYSLVSGTIPPGLTLRTDSGWIDGFFSPADFPPYSKVTYTFTVRASNAGVDSIPKTFTLTINTVANSIEDSKWNVNTDLGSIFLGQISKFDVSPRNSKLVTFRFRASADTTGLPPNLQIKSDGSITGRVSFFNTLSTATSPVGLYTFDVEMVSPYDIVITKKRFTIRTLYHVAYDNIYLRAFPRLAQRGQIVELLTNRQIVPQEAVYRPEDDNFGIVNNFKILFLSGALPTGAEQYIVAMVTNFKRKVSYIRRFGRAVVKDIVTNAPIYEVIYAVLEDAEQQAPAVIQLRRPNVPKLKVSNTEINASYASIVTADQESIARIYPSSFDNMRQALVNKIDFAIKDSLPEWMSTLQDDGSSIGYSNVIPLIYAHPGYGTAILNNIIAAKQLFNTVPFDVDGLIWEDSTLDQNNSQTETSPNTNNKSKYLAFPRTGISKYNK
jgi:hypothetical protein